MPLTDHVPGTDEPEGRRRLSVSLGGLLLGNAILLLSLMVGWLSLGELLWTYWLQSVLIGVFNYRRMNSLQRFSTDGLTSNGRPVPTTPDGRTSIARFFVVHYGFFHVGYAVFLTTEHSPQAGVWAWLVIPAASFGISEYATFRRHRRSDATWEPNLGTLLFQPYLRIIPMHLAILAAGMAGAVFLPLKVLADIGMYLVDEHMDARRARAQGAPAPAPGT